MNELKPCLIDRNKIPFKELWREASCFADDIVCAVGTDLMQKIAEAEHKVICDLLNRLQQMEVVDAEPVVRCKDCKHWQKDFAGCTEFVGRCDYANYMIGANGYCLYCEKMEEGADNG